MQRASHRSVWLLTIFRRSARSISVSHPPGNLLIPLLLCSSTQETYDNHRHIVAPNAARLAVGSQTVVHHVLANLVQVLLGGNTPSHELDHGLGWLAIPDSCNTVSSYSALATMIAKRTVTCNDQELVIVGKIMYHDIRICCDNLLFWGQLGALLEFEITNGPR